MKMTIPNNVSIESVVANLYDIARFGRDYKSVPHEKRIQMDDVCMAVQKSVANKSRDNSFDVVVEAFPNLSIHFFALGEFDAASFDREYGQDMANLALSDAIADSVEVRIESRQSPIWEDLDEIR